MKTILRVLLSLMPQQTAYAHCDIPCGIYDPHLAQLAAHTVVRMTKLLGESKVPGDNSSEEEFTHHHNSVVRMIKVKEDHAEIVKHEITILWGDYFKEEHLKTHANLHDLVWKTLKLASKTKQDVDLEAASQLLENVQKIAEVFWKTKNVKTIRIPAPYPSGGDIVVPTT